MFNFFEEEIYSPAEILNLINQSIEFSLQYFYKINMHYHFYGDDIALWVTIYFIQYFNTMFPQEWLIAVWFPEWYAF